MSTPVFDRLVDMLSVEERRLMLDKVSSVVLKSDNLFGINENYSQYHANKNFSIKNEYESLSLFQKFWCKILAYIDKRTKEEILHQKLLLSLRKKVENNFSEYVDFPGGRFKERFCLQFIELSSSLQLLKKILDDVLGEHRKEYYAFLVGFISPNLQNALLISTKPENYLNQPESDQLTSAQIRTLVEESTKAILHNISSEVREKLYFYSQQIAHLERLVNFNYEKVIANYSSNNTCTIKLVNKQLKKLNSILFSIKEIPNLELLKSIYLFSYSTRDLMVDDVSVMLQKDLKQAEEIFKAVQNFMEIPLTDFLAVANDDYFYAPSLLGGGEDWLVLYRKFWKNRASKLFQEFLVNKKVQSTDSAIIDYYQLALMPILNGYSSSEWHEEIFTPIHEGSIGLIYYFFSEIYTQTCDVLLHKLNDEGNFFRKENAKELAEAMTAVPLLVKEIRDFERAMSPSGGYFYVRLQEFARGEKTVGLTGLTTLIEKQVVLILDRSTEILFTFSSILGGILERALGGRYDTVSNLNALGLERKQLEKSKEMVSITYQFLVDKRGLEERIYHLSLEMRDEAIRSVATDEVE